MRNLGPLSLMILLPALSAASDVAVLKPGARANAMGTAFSSVANDPYAIFYNPAGLMNLNALDVRAGLGRRFFPQAPAGEASLAYTRPVPNTDLIAGLGYYAVRQARTWSMGELAAGVGGRFTFKYLQHPVLYGYSAKLLSLRDPKSGHLGLGADGGLLFASNMGLTTALVLSDLYLGLGRSLTTFTIGNSYRLHDTLFAVDLKVRASYSEVFYGLEHNFFNSLLQARAGKGVALNGPDYLVLGLGFNAAPWIIDFATSIPWKGFDRSAGLYEVNVGYRFGAPTFTERFVGEGVAKAGALKTQIDDLRAQKAGIENAIATSQANKGIMETDLTMMQSRIRDMTARLRDLELQIIAAEHRKENPKPVKAAAVLPKPEKWPKFHKVMPGDTLRSIASRYYGNPSLWERIYEANQKFISRGLPVEGATLEIPAPPVEGK
ncbi:MAG: hypothetical protein WCW52_06960 [Elusimicrobiales bacterium]